MLACLPDRPYIEGMNAINETNETAIILTGVVITAHVSKRAVSSELTHEPMTYTVLVDSASGQADTRQTVVHKARRFERAAACPIATAQAMFEATRMRHPGVPCELRFA